MTDIDRALERMESKIDVAMQRVEAKIDRIDDKVDVQTVKQQELTDYQRVANGSLTTMKRDISGLQQWRHEREKALAAADATVNVRSETFITWTGWRKMVAIVGIGVTVLGELAEIVQIGLR